MFPFRVRMLLLPLLFCMAAPAAMGQARIMVDDKPYTVHQVHTGETFYSIAQLYRVQVDSLRSVNRLQDPAAAIHPGDMLIVPLYAVKTDAVAPVAPVTPTPIKSTPPANNPSATYAGGGYVQHTVVTGETLYSVARLYPHTTVAAIKELNKLEVEGLSIGQVLLIPNAGTASPAPAPVANPSKPAPTGQPVDSNALFSPRSANDAVPINTVANTSGSGVNDEDDVAATAASFDMQMLQDFQNKYNAAAAVGKPQTATGTAIWMDDPSKENQSRFYAMHKTAPIGTIIKVKNLMNNRVVYVKVIGKLPSNKAHENVVIKVSGGAARYLNVLDAKFMAELSVPEKQ